MIRLTFLLRRKPSMSREDFQRYWKEQHAPLVASHATNLNILRYIQVHTIDDPINDAMNQARGGNMEAPYDGVAELWWENETALNASGETESGLQASLALLQDEAKFIDLPNSPLWMNCEYPQVNPTPENIVALEKSNILKLYFPLRHIETLDEIDVRKHWLQDHGPIIRSHAPASGLLRYQQVHRIEHPMEAALREARGTVTEAYLGHAEVWLRRDRVATPEGKAANAAAIEDESKFIDFDRSAIWVGKENIVINKG